METNLDKLKNGNIETLSYNNTKHFISNTYKFVL